MYTSSFLLPMLAVLAQAAPKPKLSHPPYSLIPGVGAGEDFATATHAECAFSAVPSGNSADFRSVMASIWSAASAAGARATVAASNNQKILRARGATTTATTTSKTTTTTTSSAASDSNSACATQTAGTTLKPSPDTDTAFQSYSAFAAAATNAAAVPKYLPAFKNLQAAVAQYDAYMTYYMLSSYSPQTCANYCSNTYGCVSFNIFFERDPYLNPAVGCADPSSVTNIKCSLFAHQIPATGLQTNVGQWRGPGAPNSGNAFHVVIAGSNAYNYNG